MKRPKRVTKSQVYTMQYVYAYMLKHNIPKPMIDAIRTSLIYDALTEADDLKYDRIYTGIAVALRKELGFGPDRIVRVLRRFDEVCGSVLDVDENGEDTANWTAIMEWLKEETGIVIHAGDDKRLICEVSRE